MLVYYFKEDLRNVTEFYYGIILSALKRRGIECVMLDKCNLLSSKTIKNNYVLVTTLKSLFILYLTGTRNFIFWYQGVTPEEVGLMMNSKLRYYLYSYLEKKSLKIVKYKIGVSIYLFNHFEKKYKIKLSPKSYFIMPCFNSILNRASFNSSGKYANNIFCYAGGVQVWQGFNDILKLYKVIENKYENVFLKVYSKDVMTAKLMIEKNQIKNFIIDCVPQNQIDVALADCKFGFILREDNIINNVATPTKFGTYLANGVIPIFSSTIYSFRDLSEKYKYLCCLDKNKNQSDIIDSYIEKHISVEDIYKEYETIFMDYYNKDKYIEALQSFLDIS